MPHIKYFQTIGYMVDQYDSILRAFDDITTYGYSFLQAQGIKTDEKQEIIEERKVLHYLISYRLSFSHTEYGDLEKPPLEVVKRCFNRRLEFLEKTRGCNQYNVNKHASKLTQKEYKACRHYLFKFSLPAWYDKLPDEIVTLETRLKRRGDGSYDELFGDE